MPVTVSVSYFNKHYVTIYSRVYLLNETNHVLGRQHCGYLCAVTSRDAGYSQVQKSEIYFRGAFSSLSVYFLSFHFFSLFSFPSALFLRFEVASQIQLRNLAGHWKLPQRRRTMFAPTRHVPWALNTPKCQVAIAYFVYS